MSTFILSKCHRRCTIFSTPWKKGCSDSFLPTLAHKQDTNPGLWTETTQTAHKTLLALLIPALEGSISK